MRSPPVFISPRSIAPVGCRIRLGKAQPLVERIPSSPAGHRPEKARSDAQKAETPAHPAPARVIDHGRRQVSLLDPRSRPERNVARSFPSAEPTV